MVEVKTNKYPLKLDKTDKLIYVYTEIIDQAGNYGTRIPIEVIKKVFEKDIYYGISPGEVDEIIHKLIEAGVLFNKGKNLIGRSV